MRRLSPPGTYRNINGNYATSLGLLAASEKSGLELFLGSYPITPASDILHSFCMETFWSKNVSAEDEIAGVTLPLEQLIRESCNYYDFWSRYCSERRSTRSCNYDRATSCCHKCPERGLSTGLPTKTEQSDLNQALYGRNGEAPMPVIAAATPGDCFLQLMKLVE